MTHLRKMMLVSPMLSAPGGRGELQSDDLELMLGEMIDCGREYERRVDARRSAILSPTWSTRCGRSTAARTGPIRAARAPAISACRRTANCPPATASSATRTAPWARSPTASTATRQAEWLAARHVHRQEPCRSCWARYLCGGGCHHEVMRRGRPACDYIRGWLHYCLEAYLRLSPQPGAVGLERDRRVVWLRFASSAPARRAASSPPGWRSSDTRSA